MKSIDDALKNHVYERLKTEILEKLNGELLHYNSLAEVKTYERYYDGLSKIILDYYN